MHSRVIQFPAKKSFFLFGPRATGKMTWLRQRFPKAVYIDLLQSDVYTMLLAAQERLVRFIPPDCEEPIIIDEVQRVPALLNEVHRLIEQLHGQKNLRFILTGYSARKLRSKGINLLAGRALTRFMHSLAAEELGDDFSLEISLKYGHLPAVYSEPDPADYLAGYIQTYLREEVQQEGLTRKLQVFARFLEAASFSQGSVLNISEVARDCGAGRKLIEQYFYILEDLLLAHRLPVFTKRAKRDQVVDILLHLLKHGRNWPVRATFFVFFPTAARTGIISSCFQKISPPSLSHCFDPAKTANIHCS
jgi:predicted AAA+ superfamily ATPase